MNRIVKSAIAFLAVASLPLVATAPASATSSWGSLEFNCQFEFTMEDHDHFPVFESTVTVTLINCDGYGVGDLDNSGDASLGSTVLDDIVYTDIDTDPATLTITGPVVVTFAEDSEPVETLTFENVQTISDPEEAELLSTSTAEIPQTASELTYGTEEEIGNGDELMITGDCFLIAGAHVYSTATLTVDQYGIYTMRVIDQSPSGDFMHQDDPYAPWDDSLIFAYSDFDPDSIESNLLGCGDQIWPEQFGLDGASWFQTEDSQPLSEMWPYFDMELDPGTYTLVYLTYYPLASSDWESGDDGYGTWEPRTQSITTELWGPANGATLQSESEKEAAGALASTGVDPSFGMWAGLGLVGTGAAIAVARRRSQRA